MKKHSESLPNLGDIVRASRKEKELTLEKLSILSGISKSMLSQIERGTVSPTFSVVWNLTQCLGIDLSVLGESATTDNLITHTPALPIWCFASSSRRPHCNCQCWGHPSLPSGPTP